MGCNCGKTRSYEVKTADGTLREVKTLSAAMDVIRKEGGSYKIVKK